MNPAILRPDRGPHAVSVAALLTALGAFVFFDAGQDPQGASEIDRRYAEVSRQLVLSILKELQETPGLYPEVIEEELRIRANALAEWAAPGVERDRMSLPRALALQAEGDVRLAELRLKLAKGALRPSGEGKALVQKRELELELAKLFLQKTKQPGFQKSDIEQLWWRCAHLHQTVLELRVQMAGLRR